NFSDGVAKEQTIATRGGSITDNFAPYEVRILDFAIPQ
ncbi:MAG: hypothetical protein JWN40_1567, partial [Phycisphaerales bacterium]|nr:hypothetical protein [Phycisphaerales bacterium]